MHDRDRGAASAGLVLASASPRRRELLAAAGLEFEVAPVDVDEDLAAFATPDRAALELACRKARACLALRGSRGPCELVLGADTVVALAEGATWRLLGKPADEREARAMLGALSGSCHAVVTGVCVLRSSDQALRCASQTTWVRMRAIRPDELADYVAGGEWRDKAGGYSIQESADRFVSELSGGGFDNVVGLPVGLAQSLIAALQPARAQP